MSKMIQTVNEISAAAAEQICVWAIQTPYQPGCWHPKFGVFSANRYCGNASNNAKINRSETPENSFEKSNKP
tara:strand:+ start:335 stop:550 length:216 start_codon:yes stop_codon:yes gene_type:complete